MKLNADIVYSALKERYPVKITGPRTPEMRISRPELYLDNEVEFLSNHLYLATVDHLPLHVALEAIAVSGAFAFGQPGHQHVARHPIGQSASHKCRHVVLLHQPENSPPHRGIDSVEPLGLSRIEGCPKKGKQYVSLVRHRPLRPYP